MERILLGVLCLSGWNISPCLLQQYHYVADPKTWTEAQTYCRETYTDLATVENSQEMSQLLTISSGYRSGLWIGLYSHIDWRWSDGYKGRGADYRNWNNYSDDEPDFYEANQFCVSSAHDGGWWDYPCSEVFPFICYRGTQLDPEFVIVNEKMNWTSAQRHCREHYVDLATVRNATESQEIQALVSSGWVWIGLFRDPNIYWSDGRGSSFTNWFKGQHQFGWKSVVCGAAALQNLGEWRLFPCETRFHFVCYTAPPVKRRVVKLRIKPEDSSVDLNDPAVRADMLKKFQDRLKAKGVSGVTLKWREQPDGKVFHKEGKIKKTEL